MAEPEAAPDATREAPPEPGGAPACADEGPPEPTALAAAAAHPAVAASKLLHRIRDMFGGEDATMLLVAAVVGAMTGFGALGFRVLVEGVTRLSFGGASVLARAPLLAWPLRLGLPVVGLVVAWALTQWLAREARGHGVPEVMDAVLHGRGRIRPRVVGVKSVASALTIGTGGSVGREGPIVQIGSGLGSVFGQLLRFDDDRIQLLLSCGAAAGIAATFNAPMAGVIFAIEIILGSAAIRTFSPLVVSSVMATAVSRWFLGTSAAFVVPLYALESPAELVIYLGLGLLTGVVGVAFVRILYGVEDVFEKLPIPGLLVPVLAGLIVGAIGLAVPDVYGLGYETIEKTLNDEVTVTAIGLMVGAKIIATSVTLGGGGSGGIFAPSLFLGAMVGGLVGILANLIMPGASASPAAYALVGMGAMVAATTHAPLTAILIIFELTGDYAIILPLMFACIFASVISVALEHESIYTMKLARRGVSTGHGSMASAVLTKPVRDLMRKASSVISPSTSFDEVVERVLRSDVTHHYVVSAKGEVAGVIHLREIKGLLKEEVPTHLANADDVMNSQTHPVGPDDTVESCLDAFSKLDVDELPVVDAKERLCGVVRRRDILRLYQQELLKTNEFGMLFVSHDEENERRDYVELPPGHRVEAIRVPATFVGKTLSDLDLRRQHQLLVVGVREPHGRPLVRGSPDPARPLSGDTILIVEGPMTEIAWLRALAAS